MKHVANILAITLLTVIIIVTALLAFVPSWERFPRVYMTDNDLWITIAFLGLFCLGFGLLGINMPVIMKRFGTHVKADNYILLVNIIQLYSFFSLALVGISLRLLGASWIISGILIALSIILIIKYWPTTKYRDVLKEAKYRQGF